jgi:hypothetical protein
MLTVLLLAALGTFDQRRGGDRVVKREEKARRERAAYLGDRSGFEGTSDQICSL